MTAPILPAYDTGSSFKVFCDFEQRWHTHARGEGDRVGHCVDSASPYYGAAGYVLKLAGQWADLPREVREPRRRRSRR